MVWTTKERVVEGVATITAHQNIPLENGGNLERGRTYFFSAAWARELWHGINAAWPGSCVFDRVKINNFFRHYQGEDLNGKVLLVFRTGGAGDVIFIMAALRALKKKYPNCTIIFCTQESYASLLSNHPDIDELRVFPPDVRWLEQTDYHIDMVNVIEHAVDAMDANAIDLFAQRCYVDIEVENEKRPRLWMDRRLMGGIDHIFSRFGVAQDDIVLGIQHSVGAPVRNYPPSRFVELAESLSDAGIRIIWMGSYAQGEEISELIHVKEKKDWINMPAFIRSWQGSVATIARCTAVVSADSSTLHIAGSEKVTWKPPGEGEHWEGATTPLVGIYGPFKAEQRLTYYFEDAYATEPDVICRGCNKHTYKPCEKGSPSPCLKLMTTGNIEEAVMYALADGVKRRQAVGHPVKELSALEPYLKNLRDWQDAHNEPWKSQWDGVSDPIPQWFTR